MRRVTALVSAAAFLLFTAGSLSAQARPDFSGKWTREGGAPGGGGGAGRAGGGGGRGGGGGTGFNCGAECTITQTASTLKIERVQGDQTITWTLNLDGSDSKNTMAGRGGAPGMEVISKAKWDGNKLVVTTTIDFQGTPITSTQTISLEAGKLTVVSSSGREGATPTTTTYTKG